MNKDNIYQIIGYHGEYTDSVKKALKKLLKENHPDHHGDIKIFKLINEVKKELETSTVSYHYNKKEEKNASIADIDTDYCLKMINSLTKKKKDKEKELSKLQKELSFFNSEYKENFDASIKVEEVLLNEKENINKLKNIKEICIIMLMFCIISFILSVISKSIYLFIAFIIGVFIMLYIIHHFFLLFHAVTKDNEKKVKDYIMIMKKIETINDNKNKKSKEVYNLEIEIKNIENDLRFYNNLLK